MSQFRIDYLVLDKSGKPVVTFQWMFMEPWTRYFERIEQNPLLNKIYESENLAVLQPKDRPLQESTTMPNINHTLPDPLAFPLEIASILFSVFTILFLPGAILLTLIAPSIRAGQFISFCGLSAVLSLSLVILLGYLLNFLSKLNLLPHILLISCCLLALIGLIRYRSAPDKSSNSIFGIHLALAFVFLSFWAIASTAIAHAREHTTPGFTEFYVTQPTVAQGEEIIQVNIVNRLNVSNTYRLIVQQGNQTRELPPFTLKPAEAHIYQFLKRHYLTEQTTKLILLDSRGKEHTLYFRK